MGSWLCSYPTCAAIVDSPGRCPAHRVYGWKPTPAYRSTGWARARAEQLRREPACRQCGSTVRLEVHHVDHQPDAPNAHRSSNLATLCRRCHRGVTARWRGDREGQGRGRAGQGGVGVADGSLEPELLLPRRRRRVRAAA